MAWGTESEPHGSPTDDRPVWQGLLDHLPALVSVWDRDLVNVAANEAYVEWFGRSLEEMRGRPMREVIGEAVYDGNLAMIHRALEGEPQRFERRFDTLTGPRDCLVALIPNLVEDRVEGLYVMITDISEQAESRRDLHEAQSLAQLGSYTYSPQTHEINFSPELLRMMGRDPAQPSPSLEEYLATIHPDDRASVDAVVERANTGEDYETSYRIVLRDGSVRHVHVRTRRVRDAEGSVVLLRGVMQDETDTQRLAHRLTLSNALLTDLIGVLGHDLRQPVNVVAGYLEHLDDEWDALAEERRRSLVQIALRASGRLESLLQDILTMVNLDTATLSPRPAPVNLRPFLTEVGAEGDAQVEVEIAGDLEAFVDPVHLRQILTNLLSNAVRYGRPPYVLSATAAEDPAEVLVGVRDHGEGVPEAFVPLLFDRFTRASTGVASTVEGTGFGLHIVRELARASGGDVTYHPADPGASFVVRMVARPRAD